MIVVFGGNIKLRSKNKTFHEIYRTCLVTFRKHVGYPLLYGCIGRLDSGHTTALYICIVQFLPVVPKDVTKPLQCETQCKIVTANASVVPQPHLHPPPLVHPLLTQRHSEIVAKYHTNISTRRHRIEGVHRQLQCRPTELACVCNGITQIREAEGMVNKGDIDRKKYNLITYLCLGAVYKDYYTIITFYKGRKGGENCRKWMT